MFPMRVPPHHAPADRPHLYRTGESWATLLLTAIYAEEGPP